MKFIKTISEGFDLYQDPNNEKKYLVSITDLHQKGLDTSLENNPVCYDIPLIVNGYKKEFPVISIFKRKPYKFNGKDGDSNPVLYALKGSSKFDFNSIFDKQRLILRFKEILKKVFNNKCNNYTVIFPQYRRTYNYETLIPVPTTNELNDIITNAIKEFNPKINFIPTLLHKLNKEEVLSTCYFPLSKFVTYYKNKNYTDSEIQNELDNLEKIFDKMPGEKFQRHLISNNTYRTLVDKTMEIQDSEISSYENNINGKHILLVDDTLTYSQTVQEAINIIYSAYTPKSITILTLFSKKFNN